LAAAVADQTRDDGLARATVAVGDLPDRQALDDQRAQRGDFDRCKRSGCGEAIERLLALAIAILGLDNRFLRVEVGGVNEPQTVAGAAGDMATMSPAVVGGGETEYEGAVED